ncbi:MAG: FtsH protease activity modulator HflK [Candidatus Puniceispirillales bacterium WSBS_2018_MAG_OTU23]
MAWNNQGSGDNNNNAGPWGNASKGGGAKKTGGGSPFGGGNAPPELDEVLRQGKEKLSRMLPSGFGGKRIWLLGLLVLVIFWLMSGFYRVNPQQQGVVLRFGEWTSTTSPGLHYHLPYPIETVLTPEVTRDNRIDVGFRSLGNDSNSGRRDVASESQMITGDENIVDIDFVVFWRIGDAGQFLFNLADPVETTKVASESVMREIVGGVDIQLALTDGRQQIQTEVKQRLQSLMNEYEAGVVIREVQLLAVDPPSDVIDAFNEVQRARQDKDRLKNEAEAYRNDVVPRARGEAADIVAQAEAYAAEVVSRSEGDASRFQQIYDAYLLNKNVTKERIYIETLEEILSNVDKVIIDQGSAGSGVVPYLALPQINKQAQ